MTAADSILRGMLGYDEMPGKNEASGRYRTDSLILMRMRLMKSKIPVMLDLVKPFRKGMKSMTKNYGSGRK